MTFAAFAGISLVYHPDAETAVTVARGVAAGGLALVAFGSLLFTPFTEQYAREQVPETHWNSPRFKEINRRLTLMWAWVFAAMVPLHVVALELDNARADRWLNWVLPIVLIVWAVKRTNAVREAN